MRAAVSLVLLAVLATACGDAGGRATTNADSASVPPEPGTPFGWMPPPGDSAGPVGTIGDKDKAFQVVAALKEWSIELTPASVPSGEVTVALRNDGNRPHTIEIRNARAGHWISATIPPGATVTMTQPMPPANYDVISTDSTYVARGMRAVLVVR